MLQFLQLHVRILQQQKMGSFITFWGQTGHTYSGILTPYENAQN